MKRCLLAICLFGFILLVSISTNAQENAPTQPVMTYETPSISTLAWSPSGQWLAVSYRNCDDCVLDIFHVFEADNGEPRLEFSHEVPIIDAREITWATDSQRILVRIAIFANDEFTHKLEIWDALSAELIETVYDTSRDDIGSWPETAFSPDFSQQAVEIRPMTDVEFVEVALPTGDIQLAGNPSGVAVVMRWSPDSTMLATASNADEYSDNPYQVIEIWDVEQRAVVAAYPVEDASNIGVAWLAWNPAGDRLAYSYSPVNSAAAEQTLTVFSLEAEEALWRHEYLLDFPSHHAWSPDGRWIAATDWRSNAIWFFDAEDGALSDFQIVIEGAEVSVLTWGPDADYLAVGLLQGEGQGSVQIWDVSELMRPE